MDDERIEAMLNRPSDTVPTDEGADSHQRTPVTILFSDIKGSTSYFEQKGDVEGLAMLERHNELLLPCIEKNRGRLIKTIGDALMTLFSDPVDAVRAAVEMQNVLFEDGQARDESERIRIRIGIHTGLGLMRSNDVFGDVVNAAARIQTRSLPDQILITDSVVPAAQAAGYQVGKLERTQLEGKEELLDVYTLSWSPESTQRLIDDLQTRYEDQIRQMKQVRMGVDEEFDRARLQWRAERRELYDQIERLEDEVREAASSARAEVVEAFRSELQFELDSAIEARQQAERDLESAHERFETERVGYAAQIETLESRLIEALEQASRSARPSSVSGQTDERLERAKKQWEDRWAQEKIQLEREIESLRQSSSGDPLAAARRLVAERVKASQEREPSGGGPVEDPAALKAERDALKLKVESLELDMTTLEESTRRMVSREMRDRYDQRTEQAERIQVRLEQELQSLKHGHDAQERSLSERIRRLEESIPEAQEAARRQARAELGAEFEERLGEVERSRIRLERRHMEAAEEWDIERRELLSQLETQETRLEETRDLVFRRSSEPTIEELNRIRRELEEESARRLESWEDERRRLMERIDSLEGDHPDM